MLSAYHGTKRNLCNVMFMYLINRGQSWWWLSRDVISLPRYKEKSMLCYVYVFNQQRPELVVVVPGCYQPTTVQREIYVMLCLCI